MMSKPCCVLCSMTSSQMFQCQHRTLQPPPRTTQMPRAAPAPALHRSRSRSARRSLAVSSTASWLPLQAQPRLAALSTQACPSTCSAFFSTSRLAHPHSGTDVSDCFAVSLHSITLSGGSAHTGVLLSLVFCALQRISAASAVTSYHCHGVCKDAMVAQWWVKAKCRHKASTSQLCTGKRKMRDKVMC